jgi:hypothetical protein
LSSAQYDIPAEHRDREQPQRGCYGCARPYGSDRQEHSRDHSSPGERLDWSEHVF